MTSDAEWDPSILDKHISTTNEWINDVENTTPGTIPAFNNVGDYNQRTVATHKSNAVHDVFFDTDLFEVDDLHYFDADTFDNDHHDDNIRQCMEHSTSSINKPTKILTTDPNYKSLCPYFGWLPTDIVKLTFRNTTQFARTTVSTILKKHYKSPYPAMNVLRRDEPVATDTVYSDTPAINDGSKSA